MKFSKEFLQDEGGETISDKIVGKSRWSVRNRRVFKWEGKYYETAYSYGATEGQDESPYEYEPAEIECKEVFPKEITITVYE